MSFSSRKAKLILKLMDSLENTLLSQVVSYIVFSIVSSLCSEVQFFSQIQPKIQKFVLNVINHMTKHASAQLEIESNFDVLLISQKRCENTYNVKGENNFMMIFENKFEFI